ncbi:cholesterol side-chain cleavage enzyme, mitochondrial-like isoform X1 [Montipora foliosa]|uniref:cholesterol side-chain cleavage enzyme, mitochondrial-like isoform X1 n=1 Tax=Montipora foliosa TaxID=591990 RepID=UPI0035F11D27
MAFDSRLGMYNDQPPKEALKYIRTIHDFFTLTQKIMFSIPSNLMRPYMDTPMIKKFFKVADVSQEIGNGFVNKKKELNEQVEKGIEASSDVVPVLAYLQANEELTQEDASTIVVTDLYSACHSENIFKDPSEFRPERWMRENKDEQHAFANLQFGYGVRMCVGMEKSGTG